MKVTKNIFLHTSVKIKKCEGIKKNECVDAHSKLEPIEN